MEFRFRERIRASRQLETIEKRTSQLWALATIIICLLGVALIVADLGGAGLSPRDRFLGVQRELFRGAAVLGILLISAYFWEKVKELRGVNSYLVGGLQHYASSLERRNEELSAVNSLSERLIGSVELESGLQTVLEVAAKALQAEGGSIMLYCPESDEFEVRAVRGDAGGVRPGQKVRTGEGLSAWVAHSGCPVMVNSLCPDPHTGRLLRQACVVPSSIRVPLSIDGETIGILTVTGATGGQGFDESDLDVLSAFAGQAGTVIRRTQLYGQLRAHVAKLEDALRACDESKSQSSCDPLTDLSGPGQLSSALEAELLRAATFAQSMSLVAFNLDRFQRYNELHGRAAGDALIRRVAEMARSRVRGLETLARREGDEFAMVLIDCDAEGARAAAERLRDAIGECALGVTGSFGVASFPFDAQSSEGLAEAAQTALRYAREHGGNRVITYAEATLPGLRKAA